MTEYEQPQREEQDELVRAIQAVRRTPVPQGPPPQVKAAILEKMQSAAREPFIFRLYERIKAMKPRNKFFAAASLLISLATIAAFVVALAGRPAVAFADVKEQIQKAKTVQMTVISKTSMGGTELPIRMKMYIKDTGQMRMESDCAGQNAIAIYDPNKKEMLVLDSNSKTATQMDISVLPGKPQKTPQNFLVNIRETLDGNEKPLGQREIDGRMTEGFFVTKEGQEMELWADKISGNPVLIKMDVNMPGVPKTSVIIRDIILDKEMPDSLFSLQVPEGYTLKKQEMNLGDIGEKDLTDGLAIWAKWNDGVFPAEFQMTAEQIKKSSQESNSLSRDEQIARTMKLTQMIARMIVFMTLRRDQDFHYAGGGVRIGDGNKPIAWWKPKGSKNYRVLFGDLTFKDSPAEQVPATGPASAPAKVPKADKDKGKVRVQVVDSAGSNMSVDLLVPKVTVSIKKDSGGELKSTSFYSANEVEKTKKIPDLTVEIHDAGGSNRSTLPACSPIKLTFFDSEEGVLASWEGSDAGVTFEVQAIEPAAPKDKAVLPMTYPNFKVTIIDKNGNSHDITRYGE